MLASQATRQQIWQPRRLQPSQINHRSPCLWRQHLAVSAEASRIHPLSTRKQPLSMKKPTSPKFTPSWSLAKMLYCWPKSAVATAASSRLYHHLLDCTVDPTCSRCGKELHTVEHWLMKCPGTEAARQKIFGSVSLLLSILTEEPGKAVLTSRRTL